MTIIKNLFGTLDRKMSGQEFKDMVKEGWEPTTTSQERELKIGIVSKFAPEKDGIAIYSENLCRELNKLCKVVKIGDIKSASADYRVNFTSFRLKQQLQRIIEKEEIDVLHVQYIAAHFGRRTLNLNLLQALSQKIPVVCTMHEVHYNYVGYNFLRKRALAFLEGEVVRKSAKVIAHTPRQAKFLTEKYEARNVECIYHGLELMHFRKKKGKRLLFFGIISRKKGMEMLVKAMRQLPEYKLRIVGRFADRSHQKLIRKMAEDMKNVSMRTGWVSDEEKWKQFKEADLAVLPYLQAQYQSGALHNAVSAGIPAVVTRTGALNEIVELFRLGEVVEKTPEALAAGIRKAMRDYGKYRKGIEKYRKKANWKTVAEKHLKMYENSVK